MTLSICCAGRGDVRAVHYASEATMGVFDNLAVGDSHAATATITDAQVAAFADVSGDVNPVHLDEEYARGTIFGTRIAHGMLLASFISAVLGNHLPGRGTIYLSQSLRFSNPVKIGDTITTRVTITSLRADKHLVELDTVCTNQHGDMVLSGVALTKVP